MAFHNTCVPRMVTKNIFRIFSQPLQILFWHQLTLPGKQQPTESRTIVPPQKRRCGDTGLCEIYTCHGKVTDAISIRVQGVVVIYGWFSHPETNMRTYRQYVHLKLKITQARFPK